MADSVTPPSSPFGQPAAPPAERPPLIVPIKPPEGESYGARFRFAYVGLALVVGAAVAVLVVVLLQGRPAAGPHWSTWKPPSGSRLDQAAAIAGHVAPEYRLTTGGAELVAVQAHAPEIQNVPVEAVVVRGASGSSQDYKITSTKNAVSYVLCGLGTRCAITSGTPTVARARLLRREALELALYTFKYVDGVDAVIALLPPPPKDSSVNWALFFKKSDFHAELSQPLSRTLPAPLKGKLSPSSVVGNSDQQVVEKLTRPYWYTSQFQQLQDGNAVLVLDPLIAAS
ncbi:MAG TPA: hypothetical protein VIU44_04880 [Gaiellaceae bacterium]